MPREKQFVFSARTTAEGLRQLSELRQERRVGWDELVIEAVSEHYGLDRAMMTLPKKEVSAKETPAEQQPAEGEESRLEVGQDRPAEETQPKKKGRKGGNGIAKMHKLGSGGWI